MKKQFLTVFLTLLMLFFVLSVSALAAGEPELSSTGGKLTSGSYVLNNDIKLSHDIIIPDGAEVTIDLNGHTLTGSGESSVITVYGKLTLRDSTVADLEKITNANNLPSGVYTAGSEDEDGVFAAQTIKSDDKYVTYYADYSSTSIDDDGNLVPTYYSYTSGAITGGVGQLDEFQDDEEEAPYERYVGGGVYVAAGGMFTMESGTITGNKLEKTTEKTDGTTVYGCGAGVYVSGADDTYGTFAMTGGAIGNNQTNGSGGGIYAYGDLTVSSGIVVGNTAGAETSGFGGGICVNNLQDASSFTLNGGYFENNQAGSTGGGIHVYSNNATINGGVIADNAAGTYGGGVSAWTSDKPLTMSGGLVARNTVNSGSGYGGGVHVYKSGLTMTSGCITENSISTAGFNVGGGVGVNTGTFTMSGGSITKNKTAGSSGNTHGGGVGISGGSTFTLSGGTIEANIDANYGGGVCVVDATSQFIFENGSITGNHAKNGAGVSIGGASNGGNFTMKGGSITSNTATSLGGAVYVKAADTASVTMEGGTIGGKDAGNSANMGGGVYIQNGTFILTDGTISYNSVKDGTQGYGGGVCVANAAAAAFEMNGGTIDCNSAKNGGGVYQYANARFTMNYGSITNNEATVGNGGGIMTAGHFQMNGGSIAQNKTAANNTYGGGVYVAKQFTMSGGSITENEAKAGGGGVAGWANSTLTIKGGSITNNKATSNGGGIYSYTGGSGTNKIAITGGEITGNTVTSGNGNGGGVMASSSSSGTFEISVGGNPIITGNTKGNNVANNVYLPTGTYITLSDNLTGGSIGVTTAATLPSTMDTTGVQITTAESENKYYESSYSYFVSDVNDKVNARASDSGYVEFAFTGTEVYSVSITGENISVESNGATVKSGEAYTSTIKANPGYVLTSVKVGDNEETIATNATSYKLTISSVSSNQTVTVTTEADSVTASLTDTETTVSGTYGTAIEEIDLSTAISAAYENGEEENSAQIIAYSAEGLSDYGLTLSTDGKITGTPTKATAADSTIAVTVKALNGKTSSVTLPINIAKATLDAPEFTAAAASKTEIAITWPTTWPEGAASISYTVTDASGTEVSTGTVTSGESTTTITGLTAGTAYTISANYTPDTSGNYEAADTGATKTVTTTANSSSGSSSYTITAPTADNGTLALSSTRASKGATVTITVSPNSGYELDTLTVTDASGNKLALTKKSDTQYTFTMPASKVTVEAAFTKTEEQPGVTFTDVSASAYYYNAVAWAVENGVTYGTSATTFSPDETCTRAQTVTFLWRAAGSPAPESSANPFTDVQPGAYYYEAVLWAVEKGITNGTSPTTFSPDDTVTRGQTVTFLHRAAGSPAVNGGSFADVAADAYYAPAVQWAVANGITYGTSATTFSPDDPCTRGQIVTFLYRAYVG